MSDNNLSTRDMILQRLRAIPSELVSLGTDYLLQQPIGSLIDEHFVVGQITQRWQNDWRRVSVGWSLYLRLLIIQRALQEIS